MIPYVIVPYLCDLINPHAGGQWGGGGGGGANYYLTLNSSTSKTAIAI